MKKNFLIAAILALVLSVSGFGQTTTTQTTLSAAVTDNTGNIITVAAATGFTAGTTAVVIDSEYMTVREVSGLRITVTRAQGSTGPTPHASGTRVWVGPMGASGPFVTNIRNGPCTAANNLYNPLISVPGGVVMYCTGSRYQVVYPTPLANTFVPVTQVSAAYTATIADYIIGYTAQAAVYTVTLPAAASSTGKVYIIKNQTSGATNTIWVTSSSGVVDGATSDAVFGAYAENRYFSNGTAWFSW